MFTTDFLLPSPYSNSLSPSLSPPPFSLSFFPLYVATGAGGDSNSHSESTDSPPPDLCPPHHHTLTTLTGSDSQCSSSSTAESALLPGGEKAAQGGAELKMVSERVLNYVLAAVVTWILFADSQCRQWSCQSSDQHAA